MPGLPDQSCRKACLGEEERGKVGYPGKQLHFSIHRKGHLLQPADIPIDSYGGNTWGS